MNRKKRKLIKIRSKNIFRKYGFHKTLVIHTLRMPIWSYKEIIEKGIILMGLAK